MCPSNQEKQSQAVKVIVGLSGGVDSAVAALLLIKDGYDVEGLFMKNWEDDDQPGQCSAEADLKDVRAVCAVLGIKLHTVNFSDRYRDDVFEHFLREYQVGRTPNPDILCNREIKFKAFLSHAIELGADYIATGHYVRRVNVDDEVQLHRGLDETKDQSYFLHALNQQQLKPSLFPLGELKKKQVRSIAKEAGFLNHQKKDSTGICFIGERHFTEFLKQYLLTHPGNIEDENGRIIGKHQGLMYYTIGQRKGLNIGGGVGESEDAWYIAGKDIKHNVLIAVQGQNHPALWKGGLVCNEIHWITGKLPTFPFRCTAKIRYRHQDASCTVSRRDHGYLVTFDEPQLAITEGQSLVLYRASQCLGGGVIEAVLDCQCHLL